MAQNNRKNRNEIAVLERTRMQMPAYVGERYGIDEDGWRALVEAVFPNAKSVGAVMMALAYCQQRHLDIFQRPVHIVPMWNGNRMVETVWPGIAQLRITAQRQPEFAGYDDCVFGPLITEHFKGKARGRNETTYDVEAEVTYPEWAQFTVYKMMHGQRIALPGPKVWWREEFSDRATAAGSCPNEMWARRPKGQFEKVAEAAALRRAFPDVLGNEYVAEEMDGRTLGVGKGQTIDAEYSEVHEQRAAPPPSESKPKRSDYQEQRRDPPREQGSTGDKDKAAAPPPAASDHPLDQPGVPENPSQWNEFVEMLRKRCEGFSHPDQVTEEQERQQFRIDQAPPNIQADCYEMLANVAESLEIPPQDAADGTDEEGGPSEEGDS